MKSTVDPYVFIEEQRDGYVRYLRTADGRRWEVWGTCVPGGGCMEGAVEPDPGPPEGRLDIPVTPELVCRCAEEQFRFVELT